MLLPDNLKVKQKVKFIEHFTILYRRENRYNILYVIAR